MPSKSLGGCSSLPLGVVLAAHKIAYLVDNLVLNRPQAGLQAHLECPRADVWGNGRGFYWLRTTACAALRLLGAVDVDQASDEEEEDLIVLPPTQGFRDAGEVILEWSRPRER